MEKYKEEFIEFMAEAGVLTFGDFTLKSGRKSPFFINTGRYVTGSQLLRLGDFYAQALERHFGTDFDVLFGPAYKGIPLAVICAQALYTRYGKDVKYTSNRKEIKDHGDKGILLGSPLKDGDRVIIIEDVTTSGLSIEESVPILKAQADVKICGLVVSIDRQEKGRSGDRKALAEISDKYGFEAHPVVTMEEVVKYLLNREVNGSVLLDDAMKQRIDEYYEQYG